MRDPSVSVHWDLLSQEYWVRPEDAFYKVLGTREHLAELPVVSSSILSLIG